LSFPWEQQQIATKVVVKLLHQAVTQGSLQRATKHRSGWLSALGGKISM